MTLYCDLRRQNVDSTAFFYAIDKFNRSHPSSNDEIFCLSSPGVVQHSEKRKSTAKIFTENFEIATKLTTEPENEVTEEDYAVVDDIVVQMHLTKAETEVINCYMSGLGHCEIASILGINRMTVRRRRERAYAKYLECFTD